MSINDRNLLLELFEANNCANTNCGKFRCTKFKKVLRHIKNCSKSDCDEFYCIRSRAAIKHNSGCKDETCYICSPVNKIKNYCTNELCHNCCKKSSIKADFCTDTNSTSSTSIQTTDNKKSRDLHLQMHLDMFLHAIYCKKKTCSTECIKMKIFIQHKKRCKSLDYCFRCETFEYVRSLHSKQCIDSKCEYCNVY